MARTMARVEDLHVELARNSQARVRGNSEEQASGMRGIAVPVFGGGTAVVASIAIGECTPRPMGKIGALAEELRP